MKRCTYCEFHTELIFEQKPICVACMCRMEAGHKLVPKKRKEKKSTDFSERQEHVQVDPSNPERQAVPSVRQFRSVIGSSQPGLPEQPAGPPGPTAG